MGGPLSSATTWSCQSPRQMHDRMTKRGGLSAQGCLCMEGNMTECCLKHLYERGEENAHFYSVVLAGGPHCVSLIIICAQQEEGFCSKVSQWATSFSLATFFLDWIDWKWLIIRGFNLKSKVLGKNRIPSLGAFVLINTQRTIQLKIKLTTDLHT